MEHLDLLIGSICVAWVVWSTFLVVIICMNLGRLRRNDEKWNSIQKNRSMDIDKARMLLRFFFGYCYWTLYIVGSILGITIVLILAGISWLSDWLFGWEK